MSLLLHIIQTQRDVTP